MTWRHSFESGEGAPRIARFAKIGLVETTEREIDMAVREIVVKAFDRATEVLRARRANLDEGARLLLAQETVTADQFPAIHSTAAKAAPAAQGAELHRR